MNRARSFLFPKTVVKLSFHFISSEVGTLLILNTIKMTFKHIFSVANSYWNELTPIRYQFEEKAADSFWLWFDSIFLWQVKVGRSGTFLFMFAELRSRNFFFTAEQHTSCCQFYRRQHQGQWCVPLTMEKTIGAL